MATSASEHWHLPVQIGVCQRRPNTSTGIAVVQGNVAAMARNSLAGASCVQVTVSRNLKLDSIAALQLQVQAERATLALSIYEHYTTLLSKGEVEVVAPHRAGSTASVGTVPVHARLLVLEGRALPTV